jgi:hypothetical protein
MSASSSVLDSEGLATVGGPLEGDIVVVVSAGIGDGGF